MLWLKAFHIVFVVSWFAGLFYLPRLFVYHCATTDAPGLERFALAVTFGLAMVATEPAFLEFTWLRVKLVLVAALIGYHLWCYALMRALIEGRNRHSQRWFRVFNEVPGLLLIAIVVLVVVKP
jgi:putative membrane protein